MTARFDLKGEIGQGTARAAALASFLKDNPGPVDLFINSPGGDAVEGAALMAEIQRHGNVTAHLQGICASAATLPAVAARRIVMHSAAILMIHEPAVEAWGTSDVLHSAGEALEKLTGIYAAAYASATGNDQALIEGRRWEDLEPGLQARSEPVTPQAEFWAKKIRGGAYVAASAINHQLAREMVSAGLVGANDLRRIGVYL